MRLNHFALGRNITFLGVCLCFMFKNGLSAGQTPHAPKSRYEGFHINYDALAKTPDLELTKTAMNRQIDMVVEVGLPDSVLDFFRHVPINIVPSLHAAGIYEGGKQKDIKISQHFILRGRKSVLLHELLHAFHDQKLPYSFKNKTILTFYERAKERNAYDPKSHMMKNAAEYFASTGTAFLFGVTALEPKTREKIRTEQTAYYKHLQSLFGEAAGHYAGSLNEGMDKLRAMKEQQRPEKEDEGE